METKGYASASSSSERMRYLTLVFTNYKIVYSIAKISLHKVALAWESQLIVTLDIEGNIIYYIKRKKV
jgi:hypothetical protein